MTRSGEYLAEHIRIALAERGPHHMGLVVHADAEEVRIRGPIDTEEDRESILEIVREFAEGRRIVDDLEPAQEDRNVRTERLT